MTDEAANAMNPDIWQAVLLTAHLAALTTAVLMVIAVPLAWWLARDTANHAMRFVQGLVEAIVALPLVLPPTVLGFYLLLAFSPNAGFGAFLAESIGLHLAFSFEGLLVASIIYSLPFAVQPLQQAFASLNATYVAMAASLGAGFYDRARTIIVPLCKRGFLSAAILTFAHTVGEFGVILMIGGNIAGETRVLSIALFEAVDMGDYGAAHTIAGGLLIFSVAVLTLVYGLNRAQSHAPTSPPRS